MGWLLFCVEIIFIPVTANIVILIRGGIVYEGRSMN